MVVNGSSFLVDVVGGGSTTAVPYIDRRRIVSSFANRIVRHRWTNLQPRDQQQHRRCPLPHDGVDHNDGNETKYDVVYRKYPSGIPYDNCIFLDDSDTILTIDNRGYADIVRAATRGRIDGTSTNPPPTAEHNCKVLCHNLAIATGATTVNGVTTFPLHSVKNGEAFAVGMPTGELRVFATERATTLYVSKLSKNLRSCQILRPIEPPNSSLFRSQTNGDGERSPFVTMGFHVTAPQRSALRIDTNMSLPHELQYSLPHEMKQIHTHSSHWDFSEASCSSFRAVHVGQEADTLVLRLFDERTPHAHSDYWVDVDTVRNVDISSICFLSDHVVATTQNGNSGSTKRDNILKLWDIRMNRNGSSFSNVSLSSLPCDSAHKVPAPIRIPPTSSKLSRLTQIRNRHVVASLEDGMGHFVIDPFRGIAVQCVVPGGDMCCSLFAVDKQHSTVAHYGRWPIGDSRQTIALHPLETSVGDSYYTRANALENHGHSRKRKHPESRCSTLEMSLEDCDGLATQLSCLSFNTFGTSLVGGSVDGDIFAWHI